MSITGTSLPGVIAFRREIQVHLSIHFSRVLGSVVVHDGSLPGSIGRPQRGSESKKAEKAAVSGLASGREVAYGEMPKNFGARGVPARITRCTCNIVSAECRSVSVCLPASSSVILFIFPKA